MGWTDRRRVPPTVRYALAAPLAQTLREPPAGGSAGQDHASGGNGNSGQEPPEPRDERRPRDARTGMEDDEQGSAGQGAPRPPDDEGATAQPADERQDEAPRRDRRALPVYDVATGQDLETAVNLDNTLLQAMFPDLTIALGQVPEPPANASAEQAEAHYEAVIRDLAEDLAGQQDLALDMATGARKEGRFMFTTGRVGRMVADTFEKIMAYAGLLASPCQRPPQLLKSLRVLVVKQGEMGTGDCAGKMSTRVAEAFGKDGSQVGQFRLGIRLGEDTLVVGKGTLKQMDWQDVDADGQGYDLIIPDSSFKGNAPAFGEHTLDSHLGFVAWSQERRTKFSYQPLQWFDPALVEQCVFPRADARIPVLLEAMASPEGACAYLKIEREALDAEARETGQGELAAEDVEDHVPAVLEEVLAADVTGDLFDHPFVQSGLRRQLRQSWHDLAVSGGVKVPSFTGVPDSFRGQVDWLPDGFVVCPELPTGEVLATRYPIRTRHDVQVWRNVRSIKDLQAAGFQPADEAEAGRITSFFLYARKHKGAVFMSHPTAARLGGDFDGDNFQMMPVSPEYRPLDQIEHPNRDWSDLTPLVDQARREQWGHGVITTKVKRRLATHVAPERPEDVTGKNQMWLDSAAIHQGGHRREFLTDLAHHLDGQGLPAEEFAELRQTLVDAYRDPTRSLDEAVQIAATHGLNAHDWIGRRETDLFSLARRYNREQLARQAVKNVDSRLGQIVYTISRVNASNLYTPARKEQIILRLAEELQAEVDKFKYDTAADMEFVDAIRKEVGRDLVWLDVHKDPDTFTRETHLSHQDDAVSHLWNHVTVQFRGWERAPQPLSHYKDMIPTEFTSVQLDVARQQVRAYGKRMGQAIRTEDKKAIASAIQDLEAWSDGFTDPQERRQMAQAVWHAAHEAKTTTGTASAAFHAFRPEIMAQLHQPRPRESSSIVILGAQHAGNLGERVVDYQQPRTVRLQVMLEPYTDSYGRQEQRLAAYELDAGGRPGQRLGYLPKDAPRQTGRYIATLQKEEGKKRIAGKLSPLRDWGEEAA